MIVATGARLVSQTWTLKIQFGAEPDVLGDGDRLDAAGDVVDAERRALLVDAWPLSTVQVAHDPTGRRSGSAARAKAHVAQVVAQVFVPGAMRSPGHRRVWRARTA